MFLSFELNAFLMMRKSSELHNFAFERRSERGCGSASHYESLSTQQQPAQLSNVVVIFRACQRTSSHNGNKTQEKSSLVFCLLKKKSKQEEERYDASQFFIQLQLSVQHSPSLRVKKCVTICLMSMRLKIELGHGVESLSPWKMIGDIREREEDFLLIRSCDVETRD